MNERVRIIGVAGAAGSGKDTATDLLCELFDAENLSTSEFVRAMARQVYQLAPDFNPVRDQLFTVGSFLRDEIDPAFTVKMCIFQAQVLGKERILISGLRSMGEAEAVRAAGGIIVAIDADPAVRYERIYKRGRDSEAKKTFEEFLEQDKRENEGLSAIGPQRGIRYIVENADIVISNNGSLEELKAALKQQAAPVFN